MVIDLGFGADTVKGAGSGSVIYTGARDEAQDTLRLGDDIYYADAGFEDRFKSFGFTLNGAGRYLYSESQWTSGLFLKYSRNVDGDLVIRDMLGRDTFVANYVNTPRAFAARAGAQRRRKPQGRSFFKSAFLPSRSRRMPRTGTETPPFPAASAELR